MTKDLAVAAVTAVLTALTGLLVGLVVVALVLATVNDPDDIGAGVVLVRTVLVGGALYLVVTAIRRRTRSAPETGGYLAASSRAAAPVAAIVAGAALGGLLDPFTWEGRLLLGQAVLEPGIATAAIDLVLWTAIAAAAAWERQPAPRRA